MADLGSYTTSNIRVVTCAWGMCNWMITPLLETTRYHWPAMPLTPVVITDDPPGNLPDYVELYDVRGHWEPRFFSDRLRDVLDWIEEEIIFYLSVDRFMLDDVPEGTLETVAQYMIEQGDIVRGGVAHAPSLVSNCALVETWRGLNFVRCANLEHCSLEAGVGIGHALFRKKYLLELLEPGWDIWTAEVGATGKMLTHYPNLHSVSVMPSLFQTTDLCYSYRGQNRSGYWHLEMLPEWDREMVEYFAPSGTRWR